MQVDDPARARPSTMGRTHLRREDARLVTGQARFLGDLHEPGMAYCVFVRSMQAHGRLEQVTVTDALDAPGVVAAWTAADLGLTDIPGNTGRGPEAPSMARPPLASERVRYAGEPVAIVVADSRTAAADGAELVELWIEPEPPVVDMDEALADEVLLFPRAGTNVVGRNATAPSTRQNGDWPVCATVTVDNQRIVPVPVEPLGIKARPEPDGRLTIWCGHQAPHRLRHQLASLLDIDEQLIRVIVPDVGGAFGMKGMLYPEYLVVTAAALRLGRPVMWIETRYEHFVGGTHGRAQRHEVELAGDHTGRIHRARIQITADVGAYPHNGSQIPQFSAYMATGPYDIRDLTVSTTVVVTNRAPTGSYRGAGRPEAAYAIERAVDAFARAADMDPAEVRHRNFISADAMPHTTATGARYDSGDYASALDHALALADVAAVREEQRARRLDGRDPIGLGIGAFVERAGGAPDSSEFVRVELDGGGLTIRAGTSASGQGHETVWSQVLADVFEVDPDDIRVVAGDTDQVREGTGTFASRSAQIAGSAVRRVGLVVRDRARELVADMLEAGVDDIRVSGGRLGVVGEPGQTVTLDDVVAFAAQREMTLAAEETYSPHAQTFPYGVHVAVVGVDLETGEVDLRRMVAVDDCGTVLNPQIVEGQVHGSLLQGIGQALFEGMEYDAEGQPLTTSLAEYLAPTAPDAPDFVTGRLVSPAPSNPLGAKGTGEAGCIGAPPAIVNATLDALAPYGVTTLDMPLSPERVWRAIQTARDRRTS
jgi:carbon-monoxide dehydrogenase large subunit